MIESEKIWKRLDVLNTELFFDVKCFYLKIDEIENFGYINATVCYYCILLVPYIKSQEISGPARGSNSSMIDRHVYSQTWSCNREKL